MPAVSNLASDNSPNIPTAGRKFKRMMMIATIIWISGIFVMTVLVLFGTGWVDAVMGHDAEVNARPSGQRAGYLAGMAFAAVSVGMICPTIPYVVTMVGLCLCNTSAKKSD